MISPQPPNPEGDRAPNHRLVWRPTPVVSTAIRETFEERLRFAEGCLALADEDPARAIHSYRKTIRRSRSLIRLLRGVIPKESLRSIDSGLRAAVLPTSGLRDARVLLGVLDALPPIEGSDPLREALTARWTRRVEAIEESGEERQALIASQPPLRRLPGELERALPADLGVEELQQAARRSYRRARQAGRSAIRVPEDEGIHRARKRIKELRYQLEWLSGVSDAAPRARQKHCARLAGELGEVTDLLVLEDAIRADLEVLRGLKARSFCQRVRRRLLARFEEVTLSLESLFATRSREFASGVGARILSGAEPPPDAET
ncbi:MAG: CHAD domain-containing protein [Planctomycetota bacterium]